MNEEIQITVILTYTAPAELSREEQAQLISKDILDRVNPVAGSIDLIAANIIQFKSEAEIYSP